MEEDVNRSLTTLNGSTIRMAVALALCLVLVGATSLIAGAPTPNLYPSVELASIAKDGSQAGGPNGAYSASISASFSVQVGSFARFFWVALGSWPLNCLTSGA